MNILIKNVLLNNVTTDVLIENDTFKKIGSIDTKTIHIDKTINATNKAILPAFYNLHTHAAMCLLRGYSEDKPLMPWLNEIWAKEDTLTGEDIYDGTRLAIVEMIRSGTVFFADMYWFHRDILRAVEQMNIRANIGVCFMDNLGKAKIDDNFAFLKEYSAYDNDLISFAPAPHAIYTCSGELYKRCFDFANDNDMFIQTHLSETLTEVDDCKKAHNLTPAEYLNSIGVLNSKTIAAHCVHLTDNDAKIIKDNGVTIVHNPCSNMKLSSGAINIPLIKKHNISITLGTDGCSSNNNLSMIEEMKFASLLAKVSHNSADALTAKEVFDMATINGAKAYHINAGKIEEGKKADCILVDMNNERLVPCWNLIYNMVYSGDSNCITDVICNGNILMENKYIPNEEEIIAKAQKFVKNN